MTSPIEREAGRRADFFEDPIAEAKRRFPDFTFRSWLERDRNGAPRAFLLEARWSVSGNAHGLRHEPLPPKPTDEERRDAERTIAWQAIFHDEVRRALRAS